MVWSFLRSNLRNCHLNRQVFQQCHRRIFFLRINDGADRKGFIFETKLIACSLRQTYNTLTVRRFFNVIAFNLTAVAGNFAYHWRRDHTKSSVLSKFLQWEFKWTRSICYRSEKLIDFQRCILLQHHQATRVQLVRCVKEPHCLRYLFWLQEHLWVLFSEIVIGQNGRSVGQKRYPQPISVFWLMIKLRIFANEI